MPDNARYGRGGWAAFALGLLGNHTGGERLRVAVYMDGGSSGVQRYDHSDGLPVLDRMRNDSYSPTCFNYSWSLFSALWSMFTMSLVVLFSSLLRKCAGSGRILGLHRQHRNGFDVAYPRSDLPFFMAFVVSMHSFANCDI